MENENKKNTNGDGMQSNPIGLGFIGHFTDTNSSVADVKNGKLVRIRPLHYDWKYDKKTINPWKMEVRSKVFEPMMKALIPPYCLAYKKRVYSPNRILYPLKRVDWNPDGDRATANRGSSKYVRISWNEALEYITSEMKRVIKKYGPYSILYQSDGHGETKTVHGPHGCGRKLLNLLGGYTLQTRNPDSWEGWYWGAKHVWGMEPVGEQAAAFEGMVENVISDVAENTELLLFWGCDPETTPWGFDGQMASRVCYWFNELGIKCLYICPDLNYGAAVHADKWIPIKPNTDAALQLAIAYVWITRDTYDKEYIATHSYGFDKFEEYVLGREDGTPKTPEWAAEKTGIPARTITALASEWASKRTSIAHGNGGPGIRGPYATEFGRLEVLLLAMQGLGKPGVHQVKMIEWAMFEGSGTNPMPKSKVYPNVTAAYTGGGFSKDCAILKQFIPKDLIHDALLKPSMTWYGTTLLDAPAENQFVQYKYPADGGSEIHMIWTDTPCWITCWNDSNSYIKGLRSPRVEFILAQHPWMENDCLFADIVLPINTKFEEEDITADVMAGQYYAIIRQRKCIEPIGESKSDYEAVCMIAEKLGLLQEYTGGKTIDDLLRQGYEGSAVKDEISYEELEEKGYWVSPTDPEWDRAIPAMRHFYQDPEKHPLKTPSGKIEFYSQNLAKHFPDDRGRPPVPHWIENGEGHDERLSSERAKKYPLLVVSNHGRWRVHANHDDISWCREAPTCKVKGVDGYNYEPVWLNSSEAAARGIESGDIVRIFNERGSVLGGAYVTERLMQGAVYIDHGARYDPIIPGELDRGGAINTITPHNTTSKNSTGMVVSGFLVEVEKVTMSVMEEWRKKYPEAFERSYHPAAGLQFQGRVE